MFLHSSNALQKHRLFLKVTKRPWFIRMFVGGDLEERSGEDLEEPQVAPAEGHLNKAEVKAKVNY